MHRINYKMISLLIAINFLSASALATPETLEQQKALELQALKTTMTEIKMRIRSASSTRAGDYLRLLPEISISRRAPYREMPDSEMYMGASLNTGQIFEVYNKYEEREAFKKKALREIQSLGFQIEKFINRKYLIKHKLWKLKTMGSSWEGKIESSIQLEKVEQLQADLDDIEIEIERRFKEMEGLGVEMQ